MMRRFFSATARTGKELYLEPEKWESAGLGPQKILELYWKRLLNAEAYQKDEFELKALIKNVAHFGLTEKELTKAYENNFEIVTAQEKVNIKTFKPPKEESKHIAAKYPAPEVPFPAKDLLEEHRQIRKLNRIAAHELPHLAKFRQPYKPSKENVLVFRHRNFLNDPDNKENKKSVLFVDVTKLGLNEKELHKFKTLAGHRFDSTRNEFRISTSVLPDSFQATKYLGTVFDKLLAESKDLSKETFEDIPLRTTHTDLRDSKKKFQRLALRKLEFPQEWKRPQDAPVFKPSGLKLVSEERKKYQDSLRFAQPPAESIEAAKPAAKQ